MNFSYFTIAFPYLLMNEGLIIDRDTRENRNQTTDSFLSANSIGSERGRRLVATRMFMHLPAYDFFAKIRNNM